MTAKEIIERILSKHPQISRGEVLERLDKEKRKTGGFIADDILWRMIAAEFGVKTLKEVHSPTLSICDLVTGLNDVTVVGRVVAVFPSKVFEGNRRGKVASLLIVDRNSVLRIVFWNDKTDLIESGKVKVGQVIRFFHGYVKEDYRGRVELHLRDRSEIEINPKNVNAKHYPTISRFVTKIGEMVLTNKKKKVNMTGTVRKLFSPSTFKRDDLSSGKVMRFIFADETGEIPVVVWDEKVDELEGKLKRCSKLQLVNAKVKEASSEGLEIHVNSGTYVEIAKPTEEFLAITELREGLKRVNVKGTVVTKPMLRNVETSRGEHVKLSVFELKDETGKIWVSAWRKHANVTSNLEAGERVVIKNAYVKKGFRDQPEISTRNATAILLSSEQLSNESRKQD
jgi:ssDNA-binding replication factor A large subunit